MLFRSFSALRPPPSPVISTFTGVRKLHATGLRSKRSFLLAAVGQLSVNAETWGAGWAHEAKPRNQNMFTVLRRRWCHVLFRFYNLFYEIRFRTLSLILSKSFPNLSSRISCSTSYLQHILLATYILSPLTFSWAPIPPGFHRCFL